MTDESNNKLNRLLCEEGNQETKKGFEEDNNNTCRGYERINKENFDQTVIFRGPELQNQKNITSPTSIWP